MNRLEKIGNYFVVTDVDTGVIKFEAPSKDTQATYKDGAVRFENIGNLSVGKKPYYLGYSQTTANGSVELTGGAAGSVNGITVDGVQIMSGAEAFDTDLDTTAQNVADNINAHTSSPNYTASASGAVITITSVVTGGGVNGLVVVSSVTTITTTDTNMAGATTSLVKTSDVAFDDEAELVTFLRANTGA